MIPTQDNRVPILQLQQKINKIILGCILSFSIFIGWSLVFFCRRIKQPETFIGGAKQNIFITNRNSAHGWKCELGFASKFWQIQLAFIFPPIPMHKTISGSDPQTARLVRCHLSYLVNTGWHVIIQLLIAHQAKRLTLQNKSSNAINRSKPHIVFIVKDNTICKII